MKIYFFVLGTNHTLSKIDIVNILQKKRVNLEIIEASEEVLVVKTEEPLNVRPLVQELGSAAKIGQVFKSYPLKNFPENFLAEVAQEEFSQFFLPPGMENPRFGISVYGVGGKFKEVNHTFFLVPKILREIKGRLGEIGVETNYLSVKEKELSTVIVDQRGLLDKGFELVLGVGEEEVFVGKTLAVQDYEGYSARDYGRPARDPRSGMIPPKLAKMMVNLALKDKDKLLLDPFCGSGTLLQEMALLGYRNLIGSDSSEKSIRDTETNLDWLFGKFGLKKEDYKLRLFKEDVQKIASKINFKTVDAIVTEPYLGSPGAKAFHLGQIENEISKLGKLYLAAFEEFRKVLRDDGVVVMIFPVFRFKGQFFPLNILDKISSLGFESRDFIPQKPEGGGKLNLNLTARGSIVYFRPGQTVSREIFVLTRK
ncbi:MAG TPA: DNA methyltransferase [Patescibacteria group bacterium]|nr:DNA methyltransferase [Patescibacteria group bacterium]